jgi:predicted Zn-ribbon and HTH transcriptional regulator
MMPVIKTGIRPPAPGDKALFVCKKCGHRFMAAIPILPFPVKCPECGSLKTGRDKQVSY